MLSTKYKDYIDKNYNLIEELNKIKSIRNDFAHGTITIDSNSIHLLVTNEILEDGAWGQNVKKSYPLDEIPEMKKSISALQGHLLQIWGKLHLDKRIKKASIYKSRYTGHKK